MLIRRIVTGHNAEGKSVVISDDRSSREHAMKHTPGFVSSPLWMLEGTPDLSKDNPNALEKGGSVLASAGGATFIVVTFPPDSVFMSQDFDPEKAGAEQLAASPGLIDCFEPDCPGMHTTPTVDFGTVVKGDIVLELDDGEQIALKAGDTVVQQGTRHAWRNPGTEPATVSFVMLGAKTD